MISNHLQWHQITTLYNIMDFFLSKPPPTIEVKIYIYHHFDMVADLLLDGPRLWGFRQNETQTNRLSYRD